MLVQTRSPRLNNQAFILRARQESNLRPPASKSGLQQETPGNTANPEGRAFEDSPQLPRVSDSNCRTLLRLPEPVARPFLTSAEVQYLLEAQCQLRGALGTVGAALAAELEVAS